MKLFSKLSQNRFRIPLAIVAFTILLASRRWQQLISPQVWIEDGTQVIPGFIHHGWAAFLTPVPDYLITVPKVISALSLAVSFSHYPIISTVLTWLFIIFVALAITLAPTRLQGKFFCAVAVFMVPSDPEVFGLPLYTFWWASLLLLLLALWDETHPSPGWRLAFLLLGGLSSPVILVVLPILYFRAYKFRAVHAERLLAFVATLVAAVQGYFMLRPAAGSIPALASVVRYTIPTFFGKFLLGNLVANPPWLLLAGVMLLGVIAVWVLRERRSLLAWTLLYLLLGSIASAVVRVDPAVLDPRIGGSRYFLFPFALTFWILIQVLYIARSAWLRGFIGVLVITAIANAAPVWSHPHADLRWADHVDSCQLFPSYNIPIENFGNPAAVSYLNLPGSSCADLLQRDFLWSTEEMAGRPIFPYTVVEGVGASIGPRPIRVIRRTMTGTDYQKSELPGLRVIGSFDTSDADIGAVSLQLRRGDQFLYRSGPDGGGQSVRIVERGQEFITQLPIAHDWVALDFSNSALPAEFVVIIKDQGRRWGEWSAVAIGK